MVIRNTVIHSVGKAFCRVSALGQDASTTEPSAICLIFIGVFLLLTNFDLGIRNQLLHFFDMAAIRVV